MEDKCGGVFNNAALANVREQTFTEKSFLLSVTSISLRENSVVQRQRLIKEMFIGIFLFNFDFKF